MEFKIKLIKWQRMDEAGSLRYTYGRIWAGASLATLLISETPVNVINEKLQWLRTEGSEM